MIIFYVPTATLRSVWRFLTTVFIREVGGVCRSQAVEMPSDQPEITKPVSDSTGIST